MLRRMMMAGVAPAPPGGTLYDEIMADSPFFYLRLAEASGTTAINATGGTNGNYFGNCSLGNPALYSGGPTSYSPADNTGRPNYPGAAMPGVGIGEMTLGCVYQPSSITGLHYLVMRDRSTVVGSGNRYWQWRTNGLNFEFIKLGGTVQTVSVAHGLAAGVPALVHVRVSSAGSVTFFVNGSSVGSGSVSPSTSYGGIDNSEVAIGNIGASNGAVAGDRYSEAFMILSAISDGRILAQAQAGGFA